MFNITLTRQQLYELYNECSDVTIHLIESLMWELADFEQIIGGRQQRVSEPQHKRNQRQARQVERVKEELWRQQSLNCQLARHIRALGAALERALGGKPSPSKAYPDLNGYY
ncbi:MAG TPA: hypothetical protein VGX48_22900 [Pyrinomonadaceae bacterium]|nr:hypothetical protein [Pyrinomonadaceae bacterium]